MDFDIFEKIGEGQIFRGEYNGVLCVIKIDDKIYDEINALKFLKHENIIKLLHYQEDDQKLYTLLEYFPSKNLYSWKRSHMAEDVATLIFQICQTVKYIHSNDYIHGNLSAINILIDNNKHVKIIDFKSSKKTGDENNVHTTTYLSPELLQGGPTTIQSDLWALGVTLYLLITGNFPFHGNTDKTVNERIINRKPKYKKYNIDKTYKKQIKRLLKRNPKNRSL